MDSWGTTYRLEVRGPVVRVISAGPDRTFGTPDDMVETGELPPERRPAAEVAVRWCAPRGPTVEPDAPDPGLGGGLGPGSWPPWPSWRPPSLPDS